MDILFLRHFAEGGQVVDACRVDERHLTHPDDTDLRTVAEACHDVLELGGNAEEVGTVDFIHFYAFGNDKVLFGSGRT